MPAGGAPTAPQIVTVTGYTCAWASCLLDTETRRRSIHGRRAHRGADRATTRRLRRARTPTRARWCAAGDGDALRPAARSRRRGAPRRRAQPTPETITAEITKLLESS